MQCIRVAYQSLQCAELFDLVATQIQVCQVRAFLCERLQCPWDAVITQLQLYEKNRTKLNIWCKEINILTIILRCIKQKNLNSHYFKSPLFSPFVISEMWQNTEVKRSHHPVHGYFKCGSWFWLAGVFWNVLSFFCLTDLSQFGQWGQLGQGGETHVDHAEELQLLKLLRQAFNFTVAWATVIHHQLCHL